MFYAPSRQLCKIILKFFLSIKVNGGENIPKEGGFILACNHLSYLDPIVVGVACSRKLNFMAKYELFEHPLLAWWLYSVGVIPVRRGATGPSTLKVAIKRIKQGNALALFPEGSRQEDDASSQPQAGVGFLASKLDVPVIPVFIKGTDTALPKGAKRIKPAKVSVHFGKLILVERRMPYHDIAQLIMRQIRHLAC